MARATSYTRPPGRPRASVDVAVFAATLSTVHELGYTRATVDRIADTAGVAKTTIYRRWPSKGALITACIVDTFGTADAILRDLGHALPLKAADRRDMLSSVIRWLPAKLGEPGIGAAFAGVFTDAVTDPDLRQILSTQLQAPYLHVLHDVLGEPENRALLIIDVIVGTLLHRMGMTGEPMVDADVDALVEMILRSLDENPPTPTAVQM
ncbi:MAG: TetR/AcrR family transcriptional regulator [Actinoallomurus sp.]